MSKPNRTQPTINPPIPQEATQPDKPLDVKALQEATANLNRYSANRESARDLIRIQWWSEGMVEHLLKGEEAYFQSLKNKVAALIQGATRIP